MRTETSEAPETRRRARARVGRRVALATLAAMLGSSAAACHGCHDDDAASTADARAAEGPVETPAGVLVEARLLDPNAAWGKLQRGVGGAIALLPMTLGGVVCSLAGIDPTLGPEIDGTQPAYAVVAAHDGDAGSTAFDYAVAVRLTEPRRARIVLVDGETARYQAQDEAGITVLTSKGLPLTAAVGMTSSGWLLVASDAAALTRLGPYAYRSLPTRPKRDGSLLLDVPRGAMGALADRVLAPQWHAVEADMRAADAKMREEHGGRAPDFGDPTAILATLDRSIDARLAVLRDLDHAEITLDASDDTLRGALALTPASTTGPAAQAIGAMRPGDAAPLLDVPAEAQVALLTRSDAAERAESAKDAADALGAALGDRLPEAERTDLRGVLQAWAKSRGDWLTAAWVAGKPAGLVVHTPAADADAATHALHTGAELLGRPVFRGPLDASLDIRGAALGTADAPMIGKVELLSFARRDPNATRLGAAWVARDGQVTLGAGVDAPALVVLGAAPPHRLQEDARLAAMIRALGGDVSFALVARSTLLGLTSAASGSTTPLVLAWGKKGTDAWARVEVSDVVVREAVRRAGGF